MATFRALAPWGLVLLPFSVALACGGAASGEYGDGGDPGQVGAGQGGAGADGGSGGMAGSTGGEPGGAGPGGGAGGGPPPGGSVSVGGNSGTGTGGFGGSGGVAGAAGTAMTGGAGGQVLSDGSCDRPFDLGDAVGRVAVGELGDGANEFDVCPGNGPEHHFRWVAPADGRYAFRTDDSEFDTVIFVQPGEVCGPPETGVCSDDYYDLQSLIAGELSAGEEVWLVLDSFGVLRGDYAIDIDPVGECPMRALDVELDTVLPIADDFQTQSAVLASGGVSECGGGPLGFTLEWQAPVEGEYRFVVAGRGAEYDPVISLRAGCGGEPYTCDDDGGDGVFDAAATLVLAEDETVIIEIGSFELSAGPRGGVGPVELLIELL